MASISVQNVGKTYRIYRGPYARVLESLPGFKKPRHQAVNALADVTFDLERGMCMGLVGANGAGKSTLLKILTGTTFPTSGRYRIEGRVASLLELGAGFHHDFTGRENIFMNAAMMGLSRKETQKKFQEIVEFSELHEFIHAPIRTYSSGMITRLGFSVAVATDPDVLILDEVFAVGDMHFQRKCADRIWQFKNAGKTLLFCSHSLYDVRQLCDQAIWLKQGRVRMLADAVTVTNEYATYENQLLDAGEEPTEAAGGMPAPETAAKGRKEDMPRLLACHLFDPKTNKPRQTFQPGDDVGVRVHVKNGAERVPLNLAIGFTRRDGNLLCAQTTHFDNVTIDFDEGIVTLVLPSVNLLSGEFTVPVWLLDERGMHRFHELPADQNLIIQNRTKELGIFRHEHKWSVEPKVSVPVEGETGR